MPPKDPCLSLSKSLYILTWASHTAERADWTMNPTSIQSINHHRKKCQPQTMVCLSVPIQFDYSSKIYFGHMWMNLTLFDCHVWPMQFINQQLTWARHLSCDSFLKTISALVFLAANICLPFMTESYSAQNGWSAKTWNIFYSARSFMK